MSNVIPLRPNAPVRVVAEDTIRHNGPLDAQLTLARFRRMAREEVAA